MMVGRRNEDTLRAGEKKKKFRRSLRHNKDNREQCMNCFTVIMHRERIRRCICNVALRAEVGRSHATVHFALSMADPSFISKIR